MTNDNLIGSVLLEILAEVSFLHIAPDEDGLGFHLCAMKTENEKVVRVSTFHPNLWMALRELIPGRFPEPTHLCSRCKQPKPVSQFYRFRAGVRHGNTPEKRWPWYCLECERKRVKNYEMRRRQERKAPGVTPPHLPNDEDGGED